MEENDTPTISVYTIIAPRIETVFMKDWLDHLFLIGVDKVYIYNNGFDLRCVQDETRPNTKKLTEEEKAYKWTKKPQGYYMDSYTDQEVTKLLGEILKPYGDTVEMIPWAYGIDQHTRYPESQQEGYRDCVTRFKSDYWFCLDPDEYVWFNTKHYRSLRDLLRIWIDEKGRSLKFRNKLFQHREVGVHPREILDCTVATNIRGVKSLVEAKSIAGNLPGVNQHTPRLVQNKIGWLLPYEHGCLLHYKLGLGFVYTWELAKKEGDKVGLLRTMEDSLRT